MPLVISDRVKETSLTTGTGTITLNGTYGGFQSFLSGIGNGNTTYYAIENDSNWEVGIGTYTQSSNTLSRDTILKSSNSNNAISLNGVSRVFCTYPSDKAVYLDANNDITFAGTAGFDQITAHNITVSGLADLGNVNTSGSVVVSGDLLFHPTDQNDTFTMQRNAAGNFFHAYIDDTYDRTLALYTDGGTSPTWKLGLKSNPNSVTAAPDHAYIYGIDSDMGLIANSNNSVTISNAAGFNVKHKNATIITAHTTTGIHIDSVATAYPALTVNGGVSLAANIQEWSNSAGTVLSAVDKDGNFAVGKNSADYEVDVDGSGKFGQIYLTTGIIFADGTTQTTASVGGGGGTDYSAAILNNTSSGVAHSGYFETKINSLPAATDYSTQILANSASGVAISGWADSTFIKTDTNTTYTAGSGMELVGTTFHFIDSGKILANSASGVAISGWAAYGISANTTNISTNTSNIALNDLDITANSASGVAISGWAEQTIINSGVAVSGWANSTFDTVSNTTAISGWAGQTIINSGVAVSGWADSTFIKTDTNTTYTAGSGLTLVGTEFNVSSLGGSGSFEGLIVDKAIKTKINTEADGGTITFDMNESNTHMTTLGGTRTLAVSNVASGQKFMLRLKQDSTGSRTVNWFSTIYWADGGTAPTLTTTANKADLFGFLCTSGTEAPGGPYVDGFVIGQNI